MISTAFAQAAPVAETATQTAGIFGDQFSFYGMLILFLVLMYFLMIRPQNKRAKEHKQLIEGLQTGDEVLLAGGIIGRITKLSDPYITVQIAKDVEIQLQRNAVHTSLPKNTITGF